MHLYLRILYLEKIVDEFLNSPVHETVADIDEYQVRFGIVPLYNQTASIRPILYSHSQMVIAEEHYLFQLFVHY